MITSPCPTLFSPFRLGHVEARNRIVSTSHGTNLAEGGALSDRLIAYHAAKAEGGCGTVLMMWGSSPAELTALWPEGAAAPTLHPIGDAFASKHLRHAMVDGARVGRAL